MLYIKNIWCICFLFIKKPTITLIWGRGQQTLEWSVKIKQCYILKSNIFDRNNVCLNYVFIKNFNWNKFLLGMFFNKFQWAKIVLVVEQSVSTEIRKEERLKYSHPSADGDRNFVVRWHQTVRNQWSIFKTQYFDTWIPNSNLGRPSWTYCFEVFS